jgi:ribosomal protein S18 acetylase RimI-like enzyme
VTFRHATPDDLEAVLTVIARCDEAAEGWAPDAGSDGDRVRVTELLGVRDDYNEVAEVDGRVVAYVNLHERGGAAHLSYLFVDPAEHGRGIGTQLTERALDHARRRGHRRATLATAVDNRPARRFYERAGWKDTGVRRRHEQLGLEMAEYALDLP